MFKFWQSKKRDRLTVMEQDIYKIHQQLLKLDHNVLTISHRLWDESKPKPDTEIKDHPVGGEGMKPHVPISFAKRISAEAIQQLYAAKTLATKETTMDTMKVGSQEKPNHIGAQVEVPSSPVPTANFTWCITDLDYETLIEDGYSYCSRVLWECQAVCGDQEVEVAGVKRYGPNNAGLYWRHHSDNSLELNHDRILRRVLIDEANQECMSYVEFKESIEQKAVRFVTEQWKEAHAK